MIYRWFCKRRHVFMKQPKDMKKIKIRRDLLSDLRWRNQVRNTNLPHISSLQFNGQRLYILILNPLYMSSINLWNQKYGFSCIFIRSKIFERQVVCTNDLKQLMKSDVIQNDKNQSSIGDADDLDSRALTVSISQVSQILTSVLQSFSGLHARLDKMDRNPDWYSQAATVVWWLVPLLGLLGLLLWPWSPDPAGTPGNFSAITSSMLGAALLSPEISALRPHGSSSWEYSLSEKYTLRIRHFVKI